MSKINKMRWDALWLHDLKWSPFYKFNLKVVARPFKYLGENKNEIISWNLLVTVFAAYLQHNKHFDRMPHTHYSAHIYTLVSHDVLWKYILTIIQEPRKDQITQEPTGIVCD